MRSIDEARRHGHPSMKGVQRAAPGHHSLPFRWSATAGFIRPGYSGPVHRPVGLTRAEWGYRPSELHFGFHFFLTQGYVPGPDPLDVRLLANGAPNRPSYRIMSIPVIIAPWSYGTQHPLNPRACVPTGPTCLSMSRACLPSTT